MKSVGSKIMEYLPKVPYAANLEARSIHKRRQCRYNVIVEGFRVIFFNSSPILRPW